MNTELLQAVDFWRERFNPWRGMNMPRLLALLERGERGQYADLQWVYYYMERSDPMIFAVIQRRCAALMDCTWDIRIPAQQNERKKSRIDKTLADEQAACLREAYDGIENFRDAVKFLFSGVFRGYAHLEKRQGDDGRLVGLDPVEQWFWIRRGMYGDWEYNRNALSYRERGQAIQRGDFVIHEADVALNRMLAVLHLRRDLNVRDWDAFLSVYGITPMFLIGPTGATPEKEREYQAIASAIMSNGRGYLPGGADIKFADPGGTGQPFKEHGDEINRDIALVGTGGLLTMLTEPGSGTLAGNAHSETFKQIARADAVSLSEVLQRDVDHPILTAAFPKKKVLAYFQFTPEPSAAEAGVVRDVATLSKAGFRLKPSDVAERTGYAIEENEAGTK